MTDEAMLLYGTQEVEEPALHLTAGPVGALFVAGALRDIRYAGVEVVRGLHFLVRDRNWATVVPALSDVDVRQESGRFEIAYAARGRTPSDGQEIAWKGRIGASPDGLRFGIEATAEANFVTCRTGFVVLHPLEKVAGCPVMVEHTDGSLEASVFPELIDPLQCFFDIAALAHEPIPGLRATCRMEGGAWEMEDHRNWMDASFKSYFRPLALPKPYTIPTGEVVRQVVTLGFVGRAPAAPPETASIVVLGDRTGQDAPRIGLIAEGSDLVAGLAYAAEMRALGAQYLVLRVASDGADLPGQLGRGTALAAAAGLAPALEIVVADRGRPVEQEIDLVALAAAVAGISPETVAVTPAADLKSYPPSVDRAPGPSLAAVYGAARAAFPGVPLGGGSFAYFPELNRRRPLPGQLDFVQYGTCSINHAADDLSVMETLEAVPHQIRSARALSGGAQLRIGPVAIGMPLNPYGDGQTPNPEGRRLTMARRDPRQAAQFGAAFAAGYLARATQGGVGSVTIMAPAGDFGLFGPGGPVPAAAVVARFAALAGGAVLQASSSAPQRLLTAAVEKAGRRTAILANLTATPLTVTVAGWAVSTASGLQGGARDFGPAVLADRRIELPPYGVACLEG